jgi:hypothetical protein
MSRRPPAGPTSHRLAKYNLRVATLHDSAGAVAGHALVEQEIGRNPVLCGGSDGVRPNTTQSFTSPYMAPLRSDTSGPRKRLTPPLPIGSGAVGWRRPRMEPRPRTRLLGCRRTSPWRSPSGNSAWTSPGCASSTVTPTESCPSTGSQRPKLPRWGKPSTGAATTSLGAVWMLRGGWPTRVPTSHGRLCPAESGRLRLPVGKLCGSTREHWSPRTTTKGPRPANAQVRGPFRCVAGAGFEPA